MRLGYRLVGTSDSHGVEPERSRTSLHAVGQL